jgi:hypothetical protein
MMGLLCRQPRACAFAAKAALFVAQRSGRSQRSAGAIQRLGKESRSTGPQAVVLGPHAEEDAKRPSRNMAASSVAAPSFETLASLALRMRAEIKSTCAHECSTRKALPPGGWHVGHRACPFRISLSALFRISGKPDMRAREAERRQAHPDAACAAARLAIDALASRRSTGGDFSPRGRVSVSGIGAGDRAASSSQTARSGRRAGSRGLPGAVRARHGARAPHQTAGSRPWPSTGVGGRKLRPQGRISGPNPSGVRGPSWRTGSRRRAPGSCIPVSLPGHW